MDPRSGRPQNPSSVARERRVRASDPERDAYIAQVVAAAPPLSKEQAETVVRLLRLRLVWIER